MAEQPVKLILDTSVYIPFINSGIAHPVLQDISGKPILCMCAVVIEELYAGAQDASSIKLLDKLFDTFEKVNRFAVPNASDWRKAGKIVSQLWQKRGVDEKFLARITNDILIALSARRIGAMVVTNNVRDFLRIREFVDFKLLAKDHGQTGRSN